MLVWTYCHSQILRNECYPNECNKEDFIIFGSKREFTGKYLSIFHYVINIDWPDHFQQYHYFEFCLQENIHVLRKKFFERRRKTREHIEGRLCNLKMRHGSE